MRSISFVTSIKSIFRGPSSKSAPLIAEVFLSRALDLSFMPWKLGTALCFNVYLPFPMDMLISLGLNEIHKLVHFSEVSRNGLQPLLSHVRTFRKVKKTNNSGIWFDIIFSFALSTFYTFWFTAIIPTSNFCRPFFFVICNYYEDLFHFHYD